MADTRSHELANAVAIDRTAESATAVLRDWDVHVTTILDDQGEVRVRAHDPRTLDAGVTLLRGNAHRALATRHYMPPPVRSSAQALPRRRARQFAGVGAVVALLATGGIIFRMLPAPGPSRVQVVVMPAPAETVTVTEPPTLPPVGRDGEAEAKPPQWAALTTVTAPTTAPPPASPRQGPSLRPTKTPTRPSTAPWSGSGTTPSGNGPTGQPTSPPPSTSRPPTSVTIITSSPSSPSGFGPWSCGSSTSWTSSGCSGGSSRAPVGP